MSAREARVGGPGGLRTLDLRRVRAAYGSKSVHTRLDYRPVPTLKVLKMLGVGRLDLIHEAGYIFVHC